MRRPSARLAGSIDDPDLLVSGWVGPMLGALTFVTQGAGYVFSSAVINGVCHFAGYKNFDNTATNLRSVAWLTAGEGLHNNHHQYPASSKWRWELDRALMVVFLDVVPYQLSRRMTPLTPVANIAAVNPGAG
jgi:fatty-acid desaturase